MAVETGGLVPPMTATSAEPSISSASCRGAARGMTTMPEGPSSSGRPVAPTRLAVDGSRHGGGGGGGGGGGVGEGAQQRGTDGERPMEADRVEAVSSLLPHLRARPAPRRPATLRWCCLHERSRLLPTRLTGSGQAKARWPSHQQLRHRAGKMQLALTWLLPKQLKQRPTSSSGMGRVTQGDRRRRLRTW